VPPSESSPFSLSSLESLLRPTSSLLTLGNIHALS
jgi:hypothetical protein